MTISAQGSLTLRKIRTGSTLSVVLSVNALLTQFVQEDGDVVTVSPDWTAPANQPTITPKVNVSGGGTVTLSDHDWYYNGTLIVSADERFEINASTGALKIKKNIASKENINTDTLTYKGAADVNGSIVNIEKSIEIEIRKAGQNEYTGEIYSKAGTVLDSSTSTVTLETKLYLGANISTTYTVKWYSDETYLEGNDGLTLDVTRSMVNGSKLFIAEFITNNTVVDRASITIVDVLDDYSVLLSSDVGNSLTDDIASATVTATVLKNNNVYTPSSAVWQLRKLYADDLTPIGQSSTNTIVVNSSDFSHDSKDVDVIVVGEVNF